MNTAQLLASVAKGADAQQARVIIDALDNLSRSIDRAKAELDALPETVSAYEKVIAKAKYEHALKLYENTRIMLHHTYKWLRDGKDYTERDLDTDYKWRHEVKSRYFKLQDRAEELRMAKNKALLSIDPVLAKKKLARQKSSKLMRRAPASIVCGETIDGYSHQR